MHHINFYYSSHFQHHTLFKMLFFVFLPFIMAGIPHQVLAEDLSPVKEGCEYKMLSPGYYGDKPFQDAPVIKSENGHLISTLTVEYADHTIAGCKTHLRTYNGQLVGPTLRVKPGDTIHLNLKNLLPKEPEHSEPDINVPHNFNVTNFHSHGLHVSPAGNSDNVLINVYPQGTWEVEISVPLDHPTGTFWYHAHIHGSTALQVSSGMEGALIIENPRDPKSLDSIPQIKAAKDQTLLLQQISYDEQGVIESYDNFGPGIAKPDDPYTKGNWGSTGRLPTINGQIMPEIVLQPGEVRRWRLIHGGIRETLMVAVVDTNLKPTDKDYSWDLNEIAVDGLALGRMDAWKKLELEPGYRSDVLVKAPLLNRGEKERVFYMIDDSSPAERSLLRVAEAQQVLAKIIVRGRPKRMNLPCKANIDCPIMAGMRPHEDVTDSELDKNAEQKAKFSIASAICLEAGKPCTPCDTTKTPKDPACKTHFMVDDIPFSSSPDNVRKVTLGTAAEWTLSTTGHPFHVHVNPFQLTRKDPLGKNEIVWRDTIFLNENEPLKIRTRYQRYIGQFVLHCHILDHEDQGMMQIVDIVPPGADSHH